MDKKVITFQRFLDGYKKGELSVHVNKYRAGDFVLSELGDKHNKPAHLFWTWLGIIMVIPLSIILWIFLGWKFALASFALGLVILNASRKTAGQFVLNNMLEDEVFCTFVLLRDGAVIQDKEGKQVSLEAAEKSRNLEHKDAYKEEPSLEEQIKLQNARVIAEIHKSSLDEDIKTQKYIMCICKDKPEDKEGFFYSLYFINNSDTNIEDIVVGGFDIADGNVATGTDYSLGPVPARSYKYVTTECDEGFDWSAFYDLQIKTQKGVEEKRFRRGKGTAFGEPELIPILNKPGCRLY